MAEDPVRYTPENLFEYINGAARMYLSFGFRSLVHARYKAREGDVPAIDLDIYDMGSELGAYGMYTNSRPEEADPMEWGSEGYTTDAAAVAWKGRFYIRAAVGAGGQAGAVAVERFIAAVVREAPGEAGPPAELVALPKRGFIKNSDRYVARDLLGHAFLPGGMLARYEIDGAQLTLFYCEMESVSAASRAVAMLEEYERTEGRVIGPEHTIGDGGFMAEDPGLGRVLVVRSGRVAAGTFGGSPDGRRARALLRRLITGLKSR
jgi:hypothetical protein